jgi:hypothetical protein
MPSAIEQIVDTYVRLNNRRALEAMLMHRQRLAIRIKGSLYDRSPVIEKVDQDIAAIQAGLKWLTATNQAAAQQSRF